MAVFNNLGILGIGLLFYYTQLLFLTNITHKKPPV